MEENIPPKRISIQPLATVLIRRGDKVVKDVPARALIPNIRIGKLHGSDEISATGERWVRLDRHTQLAHYFRAGGDRESKPLSPPGVDRQLSELAGMLQDLNGRDEAARPGLT
ncbi:MAG: hypothetical protein COV67_11870 [Nitrospinae bacterium CG11_big_fil_rev_8_21_14_0_20_56_8]|nr:MAG: hypothetical protein COV67_11870 [Nitrospinae bacterium CG11_big_fil_rev_8_21_14_0_20_56_8]